MTIYLSTVIQCLTQLSDTEFQRRVWVDGTGPEESTLNELLCQLWDDSGLGDSLKNDTISIALGEDVAASIRELYAATAAIGPKMAPVDFLNDPSMVRVRQVAAEALTKLIQLRR